MTVRMSYFIRQVATASSSEEIRMTRLGNKFFRATKMMTAELTFSFRCDSFRFWVSSKGGV